MHAGCSYTNINSEKPPLLPLTVVVTNGDAAACSLAPSAPGALRIVSGTRDGAALTAAFSGALPIDDPADIDGLTDLADFVHQLP